MGRDGDLLGLALGDALLFARELHAQDAEVGSPEIQGVEEPLLIPEFRNNFVSKLTSESEALHTYSKKHEQRESKIK